MAFNNTNDTSRHTAEHERTLHNTTAGAGHSSLTGNTHGATHDRREDGGVVDALRPDKGEHSHLPGSGGHNQYDSSNTHSSNPLSSATGHSTTGPHSSSTHTTGTHGYKPEDGGVVHALNPNRGAAGSHLPGSTPHHSDTTTHSSTGNPLSSSTHHNNDHHTSSTTGTHSNAPLTGRAGSPTMDSKFPIGNKDGTNAVGGVLSNTSTDIRHGAAHTTHSSSGAHPHATGAHDGSLTSANSKTGPNAGVRAGHGHDTTTTSTGTGAHSASHGTGTTHGAAAGTGATHPHTDADKKVPMMDKVKGMGEVLVGKMTKNEGKAEHGEALKAGHAAHGTTGAATGTHGSTTGAHTTGAHTGTGPHSTTGASHTGTGVGATGTGVGTGAGVGGTHTGTGVHGSNVDNVHHDKHAGFAKEHTSNEGAGTLAGTGTGL